MWYNIVQNIGNSKVRFGTVYIEFNDKDNTVTSIQELKL